MRNPSMKKDNHDTSGLTAKGSQRKKYNLRGGTQKPKRQQENGVMRADEVRRELGIGRNTFYEWCRLGMIPHKRVGRLIFVPRKSFNDWLENENGGSLQ